MQSAHFVVRSSTADGVVARRFGSETLLVPVCAGVGDLDSVYTLNEVGTTIWEALANPMSVEDLVARVAAEYDVTAAQARQDIGPYLADLAQLGLVRHPSEGEIAVDASSARSPEARG